MSEQKYTIAKKLNPSKNEPDTFSGKFSDEKEKTRCKNPEYLKQIIKQFQDEKPTLH